MRRFVSATLAASLLAIAGVAQAQPALLSSDPAANATVSAPAKLTLGFSEPLTAALTGVELVMTAMPGMADHPPMPVRGFQTAVSGKDVVVKLARPLMVGTYSLKWHAAGADQRRAMGSYSFTVR